GGWVTKKQAYDFTYSVVQNTHCPESVFDAYLNGFEIGDLGPIAEAMKTCRTVKESLETAIRLGHIAYEGSRFFLKTEGEITWFGYQDPKVISPGHEFVSDLTLMVYYHLIVNTASETWRPQRMRVSQSKFLRHRSNALLSDCDVEFHPRYSALGFPTEFLWRRKPVTEPQNAFDESRAYLFSPGECEPFVDVLYRLIASLFPFQKLPTLRHASRLMNVSPATLKRKLQLMGTSYSQLLNRLRFDTACEMLAIPQMTISDIALELGYSGTNNFVRAFRRMTGVTPGRYRLQQQMGAAS
ncbi:MAG: hypothetical protein CMJ46_08925, partial [Planctomyces sp.]|nr:hypothetical protein [Planctomyces sp.]